MPFTGTILFEEVTMGQSKPFRATALIVEDDPMQREMISLLLEESDFDVIQCESAEAAELVLERSGGSLVLMMTDIHLAGHMNGVELAYVAKKCNPDMGVIVTSGSRCGRRCRRARNSGPSHGRRST